MKKALVCGAGGFIGSHVTELFLREGHHVRALVHYNGRGTWGHLKAVSEKLNTRLEIQMGDVTDAQGSEHSRGKARQTTARP